MRSSPLHDAAKKGEIGRRMHAVRGERSLTLRQVATRAGLSATHISEIERGHTTPTVGALVRIASALGREPHFFLEPEWLPDVSVVRAGDSQPVETDARGPAWRELSHGIPGSKLSCALVTIPAGSGAGRAQESGEVAGYVVRGRLEIRLADERLCFGIGDGFHLRADVPHEIANPGDEPAEVLWVTTHPANPGR
jgi:transcriptional regulator with XRE-family HTH domain